MPRMSNWNNVSSISISARHKEASNFGGNDEIVSGFSGADETFLTNLILFVKEIILIEAPVAAKRASGLSHANLV
uniref:Uncharacterized protein n=1 Tax=Anguilla anguilla TaxID=7936 RepID=A0A0E9SWF8_ANGAN